MLHHPLCQRTEAKVQALDWTVSTRSASVQASVWTKTLQPLMPCRFLQTGWVMRATILPQPRAVQQGAGLPCPSSGTGSALEVSARSTIVRPSPPHTLEALYPGQALAFARDLCVSECCE